MKEFKIRIKEVLSTVVTVEAENAVGAKNLAEQAWKNGEYLLDADHFQGVSFTLEREREHDRGCSR